MAVLPFDARKLNGAWERSRRFVGEFTPGQKAVTVVAIVGVVIGSFIFLTRSSTPTYTTLFANLQAQDAGTITQKLTTDHVPYQLADGGTTILVPMNDVNQERINLAESGLPSNGTITFQTLSSTGITSSQFVQNVDYQQALEGQLVQTIESIQGVQSAKVSLVLPDTTSFAVGNTQSPSASVLVDLASGTTLTSEQVQAIVHLTASSVPSLNPQDVTVVDNNGDVLSAPGVDTSANQNAQQTTAYDNALSTSITTMLARVLGPNNAAVQVHAVLNFNQVHTTTNGIATNKNGKPISAPTSQSTTKQTFTGSGAQAAGALGSGQPSSTNQNGTYSSTQTQVSNALSQVTQTVDQAPGQVLQTSVAVLVNAKAPNAKQLAQIKSEVAAAAGLNLKGGDTLVVSALPFAATPAAAATPKVAMMAKLKGYAPAAGLVILILLLFFFARRSAKKQRPRFEEVPISSLPELAPLSMSMEPDTGELPAIAIGTEMGSLMPATAPVPSDVDHYIQNNTDEVAQLMRLWSHERAALRSGSSQS
ncbi:MAG TPA: flagellar basal-body MS-ring/collar protein FliF [Acidimicrobiales bacterium]|nr:flagellar basal-body MS-ring/collar protein FliF [Acidimicrobiales bacterium]